MSRYLLLVMSNATEGRDDALNEWYTNVHLRDVLKVEGFVAAQRFRLSDEQLVAGQPAPHRYIALYEVEAEDPRRPLDGLLSGVVSGAIPLSETLDRPSLTTFLFQPISERMTPETAGE